MHRKILSIIAIVMFSSLSQITDLQAQENASCRDAKCKTECEEAARLERLKSCADGGNPQCRAQEEQKASGNGEGCDPDTMCDVKVWKFVQLQECDNKCCK